MAYFLYFFSLVALSQSAVIIRFSGEQTPEFLGFWRLLLVSAFLGAALFFQRRMRANDAHVSAIRGSNLWLTVGAGLLFFVHLWAYFLAAANTTVAHCVILFASNPVFVTAGSWLFYRERVTVRLAISYLLCFVGLYLLVSEHGAGGSAQLFGDIMALLASITFAGFALLGKKPRMALGNLRFSWLVNMVGALGFLAVASHSSSWSLSELFAHFQNFSSRIWIAILLMAVFPSTLGHALFTYCMRFMDLNLMTCGKLLEPAMAMLVAQFLYQENLSFTVIGAFLLTVIGVVILFAPKIKTVR